MYELKPSRKSTRNKKFVARIKQQLIEGKNFFAFTFGLSYATIATTERENGDKHIEYKKGRRTRVCRSAFILP